MESIDIIIKTTHRNFGPYSSPSCANNALQNAKCYVT